MRVIANQIPRASVRTTLTYRFHPRVSAGVEYNPRAGKVSPLANVLAVKETLKRPALIVGTSSDRIGTPSGQSFYATLSKNLKRETKLPIAPYAGLAYGTYEDRLRPIGGLNIGFTEQFTSLIIFDGVHVHPMLNYSYQRHAFSFLLVRGRHPGVSYSVAF
ncbi:MAG TPA: hypothetical protein VER08_01915 [Pyrinomonadaceae bacterium]|nr:hypothetical protein [Pyrinomonadaceae bacterium]